jgi:hypothetical protein
MSGTTSRDRPRTAVAPELINGLDLLALPAALLRHPTGVSQQGFELRREPIARTPFALRRQDVSAAQRDAATSGVNGNCGDTPW